MNKVGLRCCQIKLSLKQLPSLESTIKNGNNSNKTKQRKKTQANWLVDKWLFRDQIACAQWERVAPHRRRSGSQTPHELIWCYSCLLLASSLKRLLCVSKPRPNHNCCVVKGIWKHVFSILLVFSYILTSFWNCFSRISNGSQCHISCILFESGG